MGILFCPRDRYDPVRLLALRRSAMTVRFASFNVENLFARPRAFNQTTWAQGQPILNA